MGSSAAPRDDRWVGVELSIPEFDAEGAPRPKNIRGCLGLSIERPFADRWRRIRIDVSVDEALRWVGEVILVRPLRRRWPALVLKREMSIQRRPSIEARTCPLDRCTSPRRRGRGYRRRRRAPRIS